LKINRRQFFGIAGTTFGCALTSIPRGARAARKQKVPSDPYGLLMDLTVCIGCRKCELACNKVHGLPPPEVSFDDLRVLDRKRRPNNRAPGHPTWTSFSRSS